MASLNICQTWFASNAMLLGTIFQRRVVDIVKGLPPPSKTPVWIRDRKRLLQLLTAFMYCHAILIQFISIIFFWICSPISLHTPGADYITRACTQLGGTQASWGASSSHFFLAWKQRLCLFSNEIINSIHFFILFYL